jgi:hypothetical protein
VGFGGQEAILATGLRLTGARLDGRRIDNTRFGITPGTRHLLEVTDDAGRSWRQVFLAEGSLSLVVELRTCFVEVEVPPSDQKPAED